MSTTRQPWHKVVAEVSANTRLRYGLLAVAAIVLAEGGIRWSDYFSAQQKELATLQARVVSLKGGIHAEEALQNTLQQAQALSAQLDTRLWAVSSEAVGQARVKEWLTTLVKKTVADQYIITITTGPEKAGTATLGSDVVREFRANVSFILTPQALEGMLLAIEAGEPYAQVESLAVKGQERRVEMTVRVLLRIQGVPHAAS